MDLDTFAWLLTDEGQQLLVHADHAWSDHGGDPVKSAAAVRRTEPDANHAAAAAPAGIAG